MRSLLKKDIAGLIAIAVIVSVVMFSGCIGDKSKGIEYYNDAMFCWNEVNTAMLHTIQGDDFNYNQVLYQLHDVRGLLQKSKEAFISAGEEDWVLFVDARIDEVDGDIAFYTAFNSGEAAYFINNAKHFYSQSLEKLKMLLELYPTFEERSLVIEAINNLEKQIEACNSLLGA